MTYTPLANITLGANQSTVTFSSIPTTFRDLVLVVNATLTTQAGVRMRVNNSSSTEYNWVFMSGNGSTTSSEVSTNQAQLGLVSTAPAASARFQMTANFMDYATTDKHKTILHRFDTVGAITQAYANRWANTSAITQINLLLSTGNFAANSTFALYGIAG